MFEFSKDLEARPVMPKGKPQRVSGSRAGEFGPAISVGFLIGWMNFGGEGTFYDVFARRFAADGSPLGEEFQVNSGPTDVVSQYDFALAIAHDGAFAVVWTDDAADPNPDFNLADPIGLLGQLFAADGTPVGRPFRVNVSTRGQQERNEIRLEAMD